MSKKRSSRGMRRSRIGSERSGAPPGPRCPIVNPPARAACAMLARLDNLAIIAFVALQAIVLAIALGYAWSRGRTLEEIDESLREAEGAGRGRRSSEDLIDGLGRLRRRAEAAEFGLEQRLRDLAYLADLVGVGIVRLSDDLRVEIANTAAHVFLRREPGTMLGRTAIEALGDHRVEAIAQGAREAGWSSGEVTLADRDGGGPGGTLVVRARRSPIL